MNKKTQEEEIDMEDFFKDGPSLYFKIDDKEKKKVRILTDFTIGWEGWSDNKPVRFPANHVWTSEQNNTLDIDDNNHPKKKQFMACAIYNYTDDAIQLWQVTQATIRKVLMELRVDKDWGGLTNHDLKISRTGKGFDTKYSVLPSPGEAPEGIQKRLEEAKIDPKMLITDQKNVDNVAAFNARAHGDKTPEIASEDIPF